MTTTYTKHFNVNKTPQSEAIPGKQMVKNHAGGFTFELNDMDRLKRFLILGTEGNTYYCSEKKMTVDNAQVVLRCLEQAPVNTIDTIVQISESGRAPKNDPAIFALALAARYKTQSKSRDDEKIRTYAFNQLSKVCRIPTHLFAFNEACEALAGRGDGLNRAISRWYLNKDIKELVYHAIKYQSRNGWSNRDLLRLARPSGVIGDYKEVLHWITKGWESVGDLPHINSVLQPIWAFERAKVSETVKEIVQLIEVYNLPRECVPTKFLNEASVWQALLEKMPLNALVRNLAKMTTVGLISPLSKGTNQVIGKLTDQRNLFKSRIHPIAFLSALKTYAQGHGEKGNNTWRPVQQIVDALEGAFYSSFGNLNPTGKRWVLGVDVSGSMNVGTIAGITGLNPTIASAAMALITANLEPQHYLFGFQDRFVPLNISPRQRLDDIIRYLNGLSFGPTDCGLPMVHCLQNRIEADAFVIYTDNETWCGNVHPVQALKEYRNKMGIAARLIVVGMTATKFTIADPNDSGMLDVVGFDAATPQLMNDFVSG